MPVFAFFTGVLRAPKWFRKLVSAATLLLALGWVSEVAVSQEAESTNTPQPASFSELIQAARERFVPPADTELAASRAELVKQMNALERFVRPQTANGKSWLKYLRWDELKEQLAADGSPNLAVLSGTYQQLNRNETGLDMPQFRGVSDALRQYIDWLALARTDDPAALYARQLEILAADLERLQVVGVAPPAGGPNNYDIGRRLDFFTGIGQAPELIAAIRREFAEPNAFMNMSADLVRAAAEEPIDRHDPVTDNILGTSISGTGHTIGTVVVRTVQSDESAMIELETKGHIESQNTGRNGPAVIRSTGHTDFTATKQIRLSDKQFISPSATVNATSDSDVHSIAKSGGGIGSRIVSSQGWNRANQNKSRINAIAADHAEDRIRRRIDDEVAKKLRDARQRYEDEYRRPLARRGELPEHIQFGSSENELTIAATQAGRGQLGAPAGPPALPDDLDLVLRLHDSAVNNYAATVLGGATASESEAGQDQAEFDVELPKWMKDAWQQKKTDTEPSAEATAEPFKPWSLTFRPGRPLTVEFRGDKVALTIHLARLRSGDEDFTDWDVTGTFTPQLADGGVVLQREGDLVVFPTGFDRNGGQLTSRQVAVRSNLAKVMTDRSAQGRGFPNRIEFAQLEPAGTLEKVGPLSARQLKSDDGWLTLAWQRVEVEASDDQ